MKQLFFSILLLAAFSVQGQQDPQFSQFFDNTLFVNPAYAGSRDMLNITGIHREQWVGFAGRPRSTTVSVHSPLSYRSIGIGGTFISDQYGPFRQTMIYGDFSYSLRFRNKSKLAFGLQGGGNIINIGSSELSSVQDDAYLIQNVRNRFNPNFGFGIYYHTSRFFFGLSSPKLIEKSYDGGTTAMERRHYFGNVGFVAPLSQLWKLRPIAQVKVTPGAPLSVDLSAAMIYADKFYLGALWRPTAAAGLFAQLQISEQLRMGVASEFGTTAIRNYNSGTFEVMLSYDFVFKKDGIVSPRYF